MALKYVIKLKYYFWELPIKACLTKEKLKSLTLTVMQILYFDWKIIAFSWEILVSLGWERNICWILTEHQKHEVTQFFQVVKSDYFSLSVFKKKMNTASASESGSYSANHTRPFFYVQPTAQQPFPSTWYLSHPYSPYCVPAPGKVNESCLW